MKIGLDISQLVYQGTGVATYTKLLTTALLTYFPQDEFVLFGSSLRNRELLADFTNKIASQNFKTKYASLPPKALEYLWNWAHILPIEFFSGKCDVFHTSDWLEPPSNNRKVTTIHDLTPFLYPETFSVRGGHNIVENHKRKLHHVKQDKDLVIAVSENTKKDIIEVLKIPEERIKVVYEAADTIFNIKTREEIERVKTKYGLTNYVLTVGTREPRKNLARVIEAFKTLNLKNYQLVIAGKYGWGNDDPKSMIHDTKYKILGYVPNEELPALYSGASAFVFPSLYEGFGLPIVEAMSCGCPVITSDIGAMKEIAGNSALLINPAQVSSIADGIKSLLENQKLQSDLAIAGIARSKQFSWERTALETMEVYKSASNI